MRKKVYKVLPCGTVQSTYQTNGKLYNIPRTNAVAILNSMRVRGVANATILQDMMSTSRAGGYKSATIHATVMLHGHPSATCNVCMYI